MFENRIARLSWIAMTVLVVACEPNVESSRVGPETGTAGSENRTLLLLGFEDVDKLLVDSMQGVLFDYQERGQAFLLQDFETGSDRDQYFANRIGSVAQSIPEDVDVTTITAEKTDVAIWRDHIAKSQGLVPHEFDLERVNGDFYPIYQNFHLLHRSVDIPQGGIQELFFEALPDQETQGLIICSTTEENEKHVTCDNIFRNNGLVLTSSFERKDLKNWRNYRAEFLQFVQQHIPVSKLQSRPGDNPFRYNIQFDDRLIRPIVGSELELLQYWPLNDVSNVEEISFLVTGQVASASNTVWIREKLPDTRQGDDILIALTMRSLWDYDLAKPKELSPSEETTCDKASDEASEESLDPGLLCQFSFMHSLDWLVEVTYNSPTGSPLPISAVLIQTYLDNITVKR